MSEQRAILSPIRNLIWENEDEMRISFKRAKKNWS